MLADGLGDDVDKRGNVVIGGALALSDRLDVKRGAVASRPCRLGRDDPLGCPRLGRRELDCQPAFHLATVGPDSSNFLAGVAGDQEELKSSSQRTPSY